MPQTGRPSDTHCFRRGKTPHLSPMSAMAVLSPPWFIQFVRIESYGNEAYTAVYGDKEGKPRKLATFGYYGDTRRGIWQMRLFCEQFGGAQLYLGTFSAHQTRTDVKRMRVSASRQFATLLKLLVSHTYCGFIFIVLLFRLDREVTLSSVIFTTDLCMVPVSRTGVN